MTWSARPGVTSWASVAGLRPGSRLLPVCAGCTEIRHHFSSTTRPRSRATPVSLCSSRGVMKVSTAELGVVGNSTPPPTPPTPSPPHTNSRLLIPPDSDNCRKQSNHKTHFNKRPAHFNNSSRFRVLQGPFHHSWTCSARTERTPLLTLLCILSI